MAEKKTVGAEVEAAEEKVVKKTTRKRAVATSKVETVKPMEAIPKKEEKKARVFNSNDMIPCQSITNGELIFKSQKTGSEYYWGGCGDICNVSYEDLLYLKTKRSGFLFSPYFIVLDNEVFEKDVTLSNIKECFDKMEDMDAFLDDEKAIREAIKTFPEGLLRMLTEEVSQRVRNGSLINLNIINLLDKALDIDLKMYVL